ncbi:hypothetical protein NDU88_006420 [Pleurodeles waltl]|uniref:Uncharacterized protein n=1 Tax=Pleurodeles waltl TaxID=8319 RepID=A0AAV7TWS5_PLEWA|nr:hypothetical protein NDU88_006420 [Pleurodeles waltl]
MEWVGRQATSVLPWPLGRHQTSFHPWRPGISPSSSGMKRAVCSQSPRTIEEVDRDFFRVRVRVHVRVECGGARLQRLCSQTRVGPRSIVEGTDKPPA